MCKCSNTQQTILANVSLNDLIVLLATWNVPTQTYMAQLVKHLGCMTQPVSNILFFPLLLSRSERRHKPAH